VMLPDSDLPELPGLAAQFEALVRKMAWFLVIFCGICLVLMMAHVGLDIFLKLATGRPLIGTLETVSYYYMVSIVFLPLAYIELKNEHVNVDLFFLRMPPRVQLLVYILGGLIGLAYVGVFTYQTFNDAVKALTEQETIMANFLFYVWPSRWALPLGFGGFFLAILSNLMRSALTKEVVGVERRAR